LKSLIIFINPFVAATVYTAVPIIAPIAMSAQIAEPEPIPAPEWWDSSEEDEDDF